jgi:hypothetical protein
MKKIIFATLLLLLSIAAHADTETRRPTGDGIASGTWAISPASPANKYSHVSETARDDSAFIYNSVAGYTCFTYIAFTIPTNAVNIVFKIYFTGGLNTASTNKLGVFLYVNSTEYGIADSLQSLTPSFQQFSYTVATNPDTGSAWLPADLNGTGSNPLTQFGVYANASTTYPSTSWVYAEVTYELPTTPTATPSSAKRKRAFNRSFWWGW